MEENNYLFIYFQVEFFSNLLFRPQKSFVVSKINRYIEYK